MSKSIHIRRVTMIQHISAPNDANGNPRRLWVCYGRHAVLVAVIDEQHGGPPDVLYDKRRAGRLRELIPVKVSATEYRSFLRLGELYATGVHGVA